MGYGHQRAAYPLRGLDHQEVINANAYPGIPESDRKRWQQSRKVYEAFSRFKNIPLIGEWAWNAFDRFQRIDFFYPRRNLTRPSLQLKQTYSLIKRKQWGKHLIEKLGKDPHPLIATFFIPAFQAEEFNYPGDIYLVVCDADISRAWAPLVPARSRIRYLAPTQRVVERLQLYGVPHDHITLTGFPLPQENYGHQGAVVKADLAARLVNLDPLGVYRKKYSRTIRAQIGALPKKSSHPFTIMFAVGGVGARGLLVLGFGQAEQQHALHAGRAGDLDFLDRLVHRQVVDAGHRRHFAPHAFTVTAPTAPAWAMISASLSCCLAFKT